MAAATGNGIEPGAYLRFAQVRPMLASAARKGVNVDRLVALIGCQEGFAGTPAGTPLPLEAYFRLQRGIARELDDLTASLSARRLTYRTGSFVVSQLRRAATLQEVIASMAEHFNMMHGDAYNSVRISGDRLTLVVDDSSFPYTFRDDSGLTHFTGDMLLIKVHCLIDSLAHGLAQRALKRVGLVRARGEPGDGQVRFWTVPVLYRRSAYELVYDHDMACRPIPVPDNPDLTPDGIFSRVISHIASLKGDAEAGNYAARTLDLISEDMFAQSDVAERLGISVATLRRRLAEEGTTFRALVAQNRLERATHLLERGASVTHVAEELGYSDVRAFNRAFKKWQGLTPAAFAARNTASLSESVHSR